MKPGKPCTFRYSGEADKRRRFSGCLAIGSNMVTFYRWPFPALRKLAGWPERCAECRLSDRCLDPERRNHRATLRWEQTLNDGSGRFAATVEARSSRLLSLRTANALEHRRAGPSKAGAVVDALLIGSFEQHKQASTRMAQRRHIWMNRAGRRWSTWATRRRPALGDRTGQRHDGGIDAGCYP